MRFKRFKNFWERPEERVVTSNNVSSWDCFWDKLASKEDNFSIPSVSNTGESLIKTSPHTCVSDALDESRTHYYERIDMVDSYFKREEQAKLGVPILAEFQEPDQKSQEEVDEFIKNWKKYQRQGVTTWINMAEKDTIESYKQQQIGGILMGKSKYKMKKNRLEMEVIALRDSTEENYMLNKMVNTDGNKFFVEYTLYKDYDKYFGLTLEGDSIEVVNIMEEELAEFLHQYRLSITYPQVQAVHEDEDKYLEVDVNNLQGMTVEKYLDCMRKGIIPYADIGTEGNIATKGNNSLDTLITDTVNNSLGTLVTDAVNYTRKLSSLIRETFPEIFVEGSKWEITKEDNESIKEQLESAEAGRYKPMYDTEDVGNEIDFTGEESVTIEKDPTVIVQGHVSQDEILDEQEATLSPSYIETNSPLLGWVTNDTMTVGKLATPEKNSSLMLAEKIVTYIMNKLVTEGSCTIDIKLKENNQ